MDARLKRDSWILESCTTRTRLWSYQRPQLALCTMSLMETWIFERQQYWETRLQATTATDVWCYDILTVPAWKQKCLWERDGNNNEAQIFSFSVIYQRAHKNSRIYARVCIGYVPFKQGPESRHGTTTEDRHMILIVLHMLTKTTKLVGRWDENEAQSFPWSVVYQRTQKK